MMVWCLPAIAEINQEMTILNGNIRANRVNKDNQRMVNDYTQGVYADINVNRMREVCKNKEKYEIVKMGVLDADHPDAMYNVKEISCWAD